MTRTPTIEWQVAGACNYDCSYCIQSKQYRKGRPQREQLARAIDALAALPGRWEIKCSGGEAFAHPLFMSYVVPELMARTEHRISVLTNFSATRSELMQFAQLTRGRLAVFSASLHLEFVSVEEFAAKAEWFALQLDADVGFVVNQVILPGREAEAERCRDVIEARGLRWFAQLYM
jgi:organic radical activating enzyme